MTRVVIFGFGTLTDEFVEALTACGNIELIQVDPPLEPLKFSDPIQPPTLSKKAPASARGRWS